MIVIARELLQYEKKYVNYYLNIPKLYSKEKDIMKNEMIQHINSLIFEDTMVFMDTIEDSYNNSECTHIKSLTEFQVGYVSKDIISIAVEFSQLIGFADISYIKGYNYDLELKREILLKDLFKKDTNYLYILKKYILIQIKIFLSEVQNCQIEDINCLVKDNIFLDEDNNFYFTDEFLILPFSSCEIDKEIFNLIEFKIPFNKIYEYLNEYTIKNIVKKSTI
ncbi:hypothetical protein [Terrisporobacter sp.]